MRPALSRCLIGAAFVGCLAFADVAGADDVVLTLDGNVGKTCRWTDAQLKAMPRTDVRPDEQSAVYSGVALAVLLDRCKVKHGGSVGGHDAAGYLHAEGRDGFAAVFTLIEIDGDAILVADALDGRALSPEDGPLRLIASADPRKGRWIKQLTLLRVKQSSK